MIEAAPCGGPVVAWAAASETGPVRPLNEDSLLARPPLFVVADGMGGHRAGEVASALAVDGFREAVPGGEPTTPAIVAAQLDDINARLRQEVERGTAMGTTAVGLALVAGTGAAEWLLFNVGDSRAYGLRGGKLSRLSRDHSYVQDLVDIGEIEASQARTHPHRNVVTRALGAADTVRADFWVRPVLADERFLLCSDGVTSELDDDEIARVLAGGDDPAAAARAVVDRALAAGGHDNATVIVVDVVSVPDAVDEPAPRRRPWDRRRSRRRSTMAFTPGRGRAPRWERVDPTGDPTGAATPYLISRVPPLSGGVGEPSEPLAAIDAVPDDLAPVADDAPTPAADLIDGPPVDLRPTAVDAEEPER